MSNPNPLSSGPIVEQHRKMFTDFYFGNGKPGITTRIQVLEDNQVDVEKELLKLDGTLAETNEKMDRLSRTVYIGVGIFMAAQVILTTVLAIILKH